MSGARALAVRALLLIALALFGAERWGALVAPAAAGAMLLALAAAFLAALGLRAAWRPRPGWPRGVRPAAAVLLGLGLLALDARAAGVPWRLLAPERWDGLARGVAQGLGGLPEATSPYDGVDAWVRRMILLGGALGLAAGGLLGLRPGASTLGRRAAATLPLLALATVPAVILRTGGGVGEGLGLFALLAGVLWLERMRRADAPRALALLGLAALGGALAAPTLGARRPLIAPEGVARSLSTASGERFDWEHSYGPIDWPRDGREVLRVRAKVPVYLKAKNLETFDGLKWTSASVPVTADTGGEESRRAARGEPRSWRQSMAVVVRGLRTREVLGAGTTLGVSRAPHPLRPGPTPGTWRSDPELGPGDSYAVDVYAPRPRAAELAAAGSIYPAWSAAYRVLRLLPSGPRGPRRAGAGEIGFPAFGQPGEPLNFGGSTHSLGSVAPGAGPVLRSPYARAYALARRLAAGSRTPYDYVRRVQFYLAHGFTYSETPPAHLLPLESFLFEDRRGYCQQFSGAMALLLRMGGVPARVSAGFTPGEPTGGAGERVVRDYDAHSWVEAWFPRLGWVTFDPTPSAAPALSAHARIGRLPGVGQSPNAAPRRLPEPRSGAAPAAPRSGHASSSWIPVGIGTGGGALLIGLLWTRRRRRGRDFTQHALGELERALRRTGRAPAPATTLTSSRSASGARPRPPPTCARSERRATATRTRLPRRPSDARSATSSPAASARAGGSVRCGRCRPAPAGTRSDGIAPYTEGHVRGRLRALPAGHRAARGRRLASGRDPALPGPRPRSREDLDPRGAGSRPVSRRPPRAGRRGVLRRGRACAYERLRAVLPRALPAAPRPPPGGAPSARAGLLPAPRAA